MIIICGGQGLVKRLNRFFYSRALGWMKKKAVQIKMLHFTEIQTGSDD